jgi:dipeptidyl aminopeptidase/acylaminoacyl peptidase
VTPDTCSRKIRCALALLGLGLVACAPTQPTPETPPAVAGPLPGENFLIYHVDGRGVLRRDTRTGADSLVVSPSVIRSGKASPDGRYLAVALERGDSAYLDLIVTDDGRSRQLHAARAGGEYTLAWSSDGASLGFGYRNGSATEGTGIWLADRRGMTRNVGCNASDIMLAWRSAQEVIVADTRNVYAVSTTNCATHATLPKAGKSDLTLSSDGQMVAFTRMAQVRTTQGTVSRPELYIADYNGANARKIADAQFNPRNARWSPNASKIAFEIQSQQFANITHIAIHDVATGKIAFEAREQALGMPNDLNPCWSPDGTYLSYERSFERSSGAQAYRTKQLVVRAIATGRNDIVHEELSSGRADPPAYLGGGCGWIDPVHVLVVTDTGFKVVNVRDRSSFDVGADQAVLFVRVFP